MALSVTSDAFDDGGKIPAKYTSDGAGVSPPLTVSGVPEGTAELALLCEDPDAPSGTFVHWVAWGIDPDNPTLAEGAQPLGVGTNGYRKTGYGAPSPPPGAEHHYIFTVFALSGELDMPASATADDLRDVTEDLVIDAASITGRYARAS
jgi:Raf kinase inhibitor-like YbhB/YbcL family protein